MFDCSAVEEILQYKFKNKNLLKTALTHPSKSEINYEILEFRGDAVLNLVITDAVTDYFSKSFKEGKLAKLKSYLVSSEVLTKISKSLGLPQYIIMSCGEDSSGGRQKDNIAENVMEAILAAIYLDSNLGVVRKFIHSLWQPFIKNSVNMSDKFDPKSKLQEILFNKFKIYPEYSLIEMQQLQSHHSFKVEVVCGTKVSVGTGKSKKDAEKNAATAMLKILKKDLIA